MSIEFLLISLLVIASPGAGVIHTLAAGLAAGWRAAAMAALGCTLGIIPHMLAAISGLAVLMQTCPPAFEVVRWGGVLYLLWMAGDTLRERGALPIDRRGAAHSHRRAIQSGALANLLNPKLSIFFLAFLPQFVSASAPSAALSMAALSLVFMALTLAVFLLYGLCAALLRRRVLSSPAILRAMRYAFCIAFVALGVRLVLMPYR